jgi:hypothetical protein
MKTFWKALAGWTVGIAVGWCLAGFQTSETKVPEVTATKTSLPFPIQAEDGQVRIEKADLSKAMGLNTISGLSCERYAAPEATPPTGHTAFTTSLGLDSQQVETFHRIFKEATEARLAWEEENARVKVIAPGEWEIQIPGDGGTANRQLMKNLTQAFGSDLAQRIELSADLDGFFNLEEIDPDFRHGTLRLRTRREKMDGPLASIVPEDHVRVAVQSEEKIVTFHLGDGSLGNNQLSWRLGRLIGGDEAIRGSAPVHVLGGAR